MTIERLTTLIQSYVHTFEQLATKHSSPFDSDLTEHFHRKASTMGGLSAVGPTDFYTWMDDGNKVAMLPDETSYVDMKWIEYMICSSICNLQSEERLLHFFPKTFHWNHVHPASERHSADVHEGQCVQPSIPQSRGIYNFLHIYTMLTSEEERQQWIDWVELENRSFLRRWRHMTAMSSSHSQMDESKSFQ
jgi:hypothetical protein